MKVEIDSKYVERMIVGLLLILFAVLLELSSDKLLGSLLVLAWFSLLGGIATVGWSIVTWLIR